MFIDSRNLMVRKKIFFQLENDGFVSAYPSNENVGLNL